MNTVNEQFFTANDEKCQPNETWKYCESNDENINQNDQWHCR